MKRVKDIVSNLANDEERGSALLVTLMVIVGLSLLGLGLVATSETETSISVNQRNANQMQAIAETGAKAVIEWFQDPNWARNTVAIMPANTNAVKTNRTVGGVGYYKSAGGLLFDLPYRPAPVDRFFGTQDTPDVFINYTNAATEMGNLNTKLFGSDVASNGHITEIKVYAPPIVGGTLTDDGTGKKFWVGGSRYGVATIMVTAQKTENKNSSNLASSRTVRVIVGEFPLPVPAGPLQTASSSGITFGGSSDVHWGLEFSAEDITDTKNPETFPWANAYELAHFEHGYDANFPVIAGSAFDDQNYLNELVGRAFADPWFGTRATVANNTVPAGTSNNYQYYKNESSRLYSAFAQQSINNYPNKKKVIFPSIRYEFYKKIALQARGTKGVFYFKYDTALNNGNFIKSGTAISQPVAYWVNATSGGANLGGGFYFFDTNDNSTNPQNANGTTNTAVLTPTLAWNSSDFGNPFKMSGFVYFNARSFETTGAGSSAVTTAYNMPGEPFRDLGAPEVNYPGDMKFKRDGLGGLIPDGAGDAVFTCLDLNLNKRCDVVTIPAVVLYNDTGVAVPPATTRTPNPGQFLVKVWNDTGNCTVPPANYNGTNGGLNDCSEPHEPFLNLQYPTVVGGVTAGWQTGLGTQRSKTASACTGLMGDLQCTTNSYDIDGALVNLDAILDGILFNEGNYSTQGNAVYYGALLYHGVVSGTGNPAIYFNERLLRGEGKPKGLPRVVIYSEESDENQ
ncbi:MAG TPA: hypothetical protein VHL58_17320 [Thermoanaerobaculia bacterium]|nr:hypothetical protein [Thermoanaerobaculia bacterium]